MQDNSKDIITSITKRLPKEYQDLSYDNFK